MCHSVEMYLPTIARAAAEERVGARCGTEAGLGLGAVLAGLASLLKLEQASKPLKNKEPKFARVLWLMKREAFASATVVASEASE